MIWRERSVRLGVVVLFFLSGACGLVYEVVWMRMLTLVFGATAFATSAILSSFFAGLALGSLYYGRIADRGRHHPLALYALLEAGIGVCAFVMPVVFAALSHVYVVLARGLDLGFYPLSVVRFALSFAVLLVPTTLMGGTLPVIVKYFTRRRDQVGWDVGRLYAVNTLGAVVGTVLAGFFLILFLGVREAAYAAGAVNLVIAVVVYGLSRVVPFAPPEEARAHMPAEGMPGGGLPAAPAEAEPSGAAPGAAGAPPAPPPASVRAVPAGAACLALWAVGISGFCALAFEVLWTRSLVFFLDNSTHAFTTMLTAFLLGIALGSALIARFIDGRRSPVALFGAIEVLIGVSALLAIPLIAHSTPVMERLLGAQEGPWLHWQWIGLRFVTALTVMLLPTILMGMTVPLVVRICTRHLASVGTTLGRVYFVNTVGGVVGSIVAGFVLIPLLGVRDGIVVVGLLSVGVGVGLLAAEPALAGGGA
jgi:spermidine synthase